MQKIFDTLLSMPAGAQIFLMALLVLFLIGTLVVVL